MVYDNTSKVFKTCEVMTCVSTYAFAINYVWTVDDNGNNIRSPMSYRRRGLVNRLLSMKWKNVTFLKRNLAFKRDFNSSVMVI